MQINLFSKKNHKFLEVFAQIFENIFWLKKFFFISLLENIFLNSLESFFGLFGAFLIYKNHFSSKFSTKSLN